MSSGRVKPGPVEATFGPRIADLISRTRHQLRWTEEELGARAGVARSQVSRMERGRRGHGRIDDAARLLDAMGVRVELQVRPPVLIGAPTQRDAAHSRVIAYTARHLVRAGITVAREVPIGGDRVRGWIDILGHDDALDALVISECKGDLDDIGALERQIGWYVREAPWAARRLGWAPGRRRIVLVTALATRHNAEFVRANREALQACFPDPIHRLQGVMAGGAAPTEALRVLAFVDPARRGRGWLLRTPLEPGRPILPYDDAHAFLAGRLRA